jgi:hypothetical protein
MWLLLKSMAASTSGLGFSDAFWFAHHDPEDALSYMWSAPAKVGFANTRLGWAYLQIHTRSCFIVLPYAVVNFCSAMLLAFNFDPHNLT